MLQKMKIVSIDGMVCCGHNYWMYPEVARSLSFGLNHLLLLTDEISTEISCNGMHWFR